jgi:hypothetical protein
MASDVHAEVRRALDLTGTIPVLSREFITQRISQLERRQAVPDAPYEREQIRAHFGNEVQAATRIDLWVKTHERAEHFFEIKSGKPNKGQCIEMKERLMTALAIRRHEQSYWWWGVPYNPYGSSPYVHSYALPFFDFTNEVMMGPSSGTSSATMAHTTTFLRSTSRWARSLLRRSRLSGNGEGVRRPHAFSGGFASVLIATSELA